MKTINILKETRRKALIEARTIQTKIALGNCITTLNKAEFKFDCLMIFIDILDDQIEEHNNRITSNININQLLAL
jgi:hypothetical protein